MSQKAWKGIWVKISTKSFSSTSLENQTKNVDHHKSEMRKKTQKMLCNNFIIQITCFFHLSSFSYDDIGIYHLLILVYHQKL
jgi:hypothetical protein